MYENLDDLDDQELVELESELTEKSDDLLNQFVAVQESIQLDMAALGPKIAAYQDFERGLIGESQFAYAVLAAESVVNTGELTPVLAQENIIRTIGRSLVDLFNRFHQNILNYLDFVQYNVKLFSVQKTRIRKNAAALRMVSGNTAEISIGINKYLCAGEREEPVVDFKEYQKQFTLLTDRFTPFIRATADLLEDDLFSSLKWYKEALVGDLEEWYEDRFFSLETLLGRAQAALAMDKIKDTPTHSEHKTSVLLGCAFLYVRTPKKGTYRAGDFDSLVGASRFFYMHAQRLYKVRFSTIVDGNVRFSVDRRGLEKLMEQAEKLVSESERLLKFSSKLSVYGAALSTDEYDKRKVEEGTNLKDRYKTVQLFNRIASILYDSATTSFTLAQGNIKMACKITEKAIKKLR